MLQVVLALFVAVQDDAEVTAAIAKFKAAMKNPSAAQRVEALTELSGTPHAKTVTQIVPYLQSDLPPVRIAAAKALGKFADQKKVALTALQNGLSSNAADPGVLTAILDAMAEIGDASVMPNVQRFFYDKNAAVARRAAALAGTLPSAGAVEPLIDVLRRQEKFIKANSGGTTLAGGDPKTGNGKVVAKPDENAIQAAEELIAEIEKSLASITRESLAGSQQWQTWWNGAKGAFRVQK